MKGQRKSMSKRLRFEVFKRDGFRCMYCGQRPPEVVLVVDHIVPVKEGGCDEAENLVTSCFTCNNGKGAVPLGSALPVFDEMAIAEAMQDLAERRLALSAHFSERRAMQDDIDRSVDVCFEVWMDLAGRCDLKSEEWDRNAREEFTRQSAVNWVRRGLVREDFQDAADLVSSWWRERPMTIPHLWRSFCRVCWDAIRESEGER